MRTRFEAQLHELNNEIIIMSALVESAIAAAARALENRDTALATQVAGSDNVIDDKMREIEQLCLKLLLQQQPVASDLRLISAAMKMITDIERIGDQAADIAELTLLLCARTGLRALGSSRKWRVRPSIWSAVQSTPLCAATCIWRGRLWNTTMWSTGSLTRLKPAW